jgi:hypothetical protein
MGLDFQSPINKLLSEPFFLCDSRPVVKFAPVANAFHRFSEDSPRTKNPAPVFMAGQFGTAPDRSYGTVAGSFWVFARRPRWSRAPELDTL